MRLWPVNLIRPIALACLSLFLILLLLPDSSLVLGGKGGGGGGGKKMIAPVKHLFGVGIGYQRVVHYKPVLVFSKHRRPKKKKRRPGWGWGGGGGRGKKGWSPVVVQHHIYKDGGQHHRHGGGHHQASHHHIHHPKRRTKSHSHPRPLHRPHRQKGVQSYRGWGWRSTTGPARRNPESKTHHGYRDDDHHHPYARQNTEDHHGAYEYHSPPSLPSFHHSPTSDDDFGSPGAEWSPSGDPGYSHYGSPGLDYVDGDDTGGYETEIKEHWNQNSGRPLTPLVFPGTTVSNPSSSHSSQPSPSSHSPPPLYPFEDAPKSDTSVTNIRKDFLKNHMKNFRQFQGYQNAHSNNDEPGGNQVMKPPGPDYSTTDLQSHQGASPDVQYYDNDYFTPNENAPNGGKEDSPHHGPSDNYNYDVVDDDGFNWSELNRKMSAKAMSPSAPTPAPLVAHSKSIIYGVQGAMSSNQKNVVVNAPVQTNIQVNTTPLPTTSGKRFKPSQRIDVMGSGDAFSDPGFFPTFDQFQKISME